MVRFFSFVLALTMYPYAIDLWAFSFSPIGNTIQCSARNSQTKHHQQIVHSVAIRGDDTRKITSKYAATMPLGCTDKNGNRKVYGSASLTEDGKIVSVLHNVMDIKTCNPKAGTFEKCFLTDGDVTFPIKWGEDLSQKCNRDGDSVLVGEFAKDRPNIKGYKSLCADRVRAEGATKVRVVGARATNASRKLNLGRERIESEDELYKIDQSSQTIRYANDTGVGTSGGAIFMEINGEEYFVGVHRGDKFRGKKSRLSGQGREDGLEPGASDNYGEGFMFSNGEGCSSSQGNSGS